MNLQEIKTAIEQNKIVHWKNASYRVIKDNKDRYLIKCINGNCLPLTGKNDILNGNEPDFYVSNEPLRIFKLNSYIINGYQLTLDVDTNQGNKEIELEMDTNLEQINTIDSESDIENYDFSLIQTELDAITDKMVSDILSERKYKR